MLLRNGRRAPVVRRVRELLRARVIQELRCGDILPSELDLIATYGVSRGVVREVLDLLRDEGLVDRLQGAGTFVIGAERSPITIEEMGALPGSVEQGGGYVTWELVELASLPAPDLVADRLALEPGNPVVYVERITKVDGEPVAIRSSWLPFEVGFSPLDDPAVARRSVYEVVEGALGHRTREATLRIEAVLADSATAPVLRVAEGAPLLLMERLVYDVLGRPVEYGVGRTRSDRVALTTVMRHHEDRMVATCDPPPAPSFQRVRVRDHAPHLGQPPLRRLTAHGVPACRKGEAWEQ